MNQSFTRASVSFDLALIHHTASILQDHHLQAVSRTSNDQVMPYSNQDFIAAATTRFAHSPKTNNSVFTSSLLLGFVTEGFSVFSKTGGHSGHANSQTFTAQLTSPPNNRGKLIFKTFYLPDS